MPLIVYQIFKNNEDMGIGETKLNEEDYHEKIREIIDKISKSSYKYNYNGHAHVVFYVSTQEEFHKLIKFLADEVHADFPWKLKKN